MDSKHEEQQYLDLIREIIDTGDKREDRTGTGTLAVFGKTMRFSLRDNSFPLFTTKTTFFRGIVEELLWFIRGCTNAKALSAKGVRIWEANASRAALDARGFVDREEGDLGPIYGFQWRHFGATYVDMHTDYKGQGFDQLADCIHKIKNNPTDRRIIMSAWNPADLHMMALPPCHMFCQFFVSPATAGETGETSAAGEVKKQELSCLMYQRSADMGLGVPFNVASYALLTCMMAQVCGLEPGEFIHNLGDTHVYLNHVEPLKEQIQRTPFAFPKVFVNPDVTSIDDFVYEDVVLVNYQSHPKIFMPMAL